MKQFHFMIPLEVKQEIFE